MPTLILAITCILRKVQIFIQLSILFQFNCLIFIINVLVFSRPQQNTSFAGHSMPRRFWSLVCHICII